MKKRMLSVMLAAGMLLINPMSALAADVEEFQATESLENAEPEEQAADIDVTASGYVDYRDSGDFPTDCWKTGKRRSAAIPVKLRK